MTYRHLAPRTGLIAVLLALAACHQQPTVEQTNATTDAQLNNISAHTNETDGMDQQNAALMAVPSMGQQMDAQQKQ